LASTKISVQGHDAYFFTGTVPGTGPGYSESTSKAPMIAWQWSTNAWLVVWGQFGVTPPIDGSVPANLQQTAETVAADATPTPIRLPFRYTYVPSGLEPVRVMIGEAGEPDLTWSVVAFSTAGSFADATGYEKASYDWRDFTDAHDLLTIAVHPLRDFTGLPTVTVAGHTAYVDGHHYEIAMTGFGLTIGTGSQAPALSTAEVEHIFTALTFAKVDDPTTWLAAA
jgi:hypothetical protein